MAAAHAAAKTAGTMPRAGRSWQRVIEDGFDLVIPWSDISILRAFGQAEAMALRMAAGASVPPMTIAEGNLWSTSGWLETGRRRFPMQISPKP